MNFYSKLFVAATVTVSLTPTHGQAQTIEWSRQLGTSTQDYSESVSADGLGNVYISGGTNGSLGGPTAGGNEGFLSKYNAAGTLQWTRQLGTNSVETSRGVSADGLGNVYISGYTLGSLGGPFAGVADAFVSKYDAAGTLQWTRQLGTTANDESYCVSADGLGNVYISGLTTGSLSGPNAGSTDAFVAKYNAAGTLQWTRQLGTSSNEESNGVSADGLGNVYIAGRTSGSLDGANAGSDDAFVAKYDAAGALQWTRQLGTSSLEFSRSVSADGVGNVYISGGTLGSLVGPNSGGNDAFLSKYNASGTLQWSRQLGTNSSDESYGVSADGLGNVYISGYTSGSLGGPFAGVADAFVSKYDATGTFLWSYQLGTSANDGSTGVSADGLGNVYFSGYTDGNLGGSNAGERDAFVAKIADVPEPNSILLLGLATVPIFVGRKRFRSSTHLLAAALLLPIELAPQSAQAVTIEMVTVGNPGNAPDTQIMSDGTTGYGAVGYGYQIGKYEVTAGQYTEFLNAVAKADPNGLYNTAITGSFGGANIQRSGSSPNFSYSVASDWADRPVNYVSFWDAARFANWLHNGQPTGPQGPGTTEGGAYHDVGNQTLFGRNVGARFFIPTEDEWYKAAYHNKTAGLAASYFDYPTGTNSLPGNEINETTNAGNNANYYYHDYYYGDYYYYAISSPYYRTVVGEFELSDSPYGTFDQGGNLWEWNETEIASSSRGVRGGSWGSYSPALEAYLRRSFDPIGEYNDTGFRVASIQVPEPSAILLLGFGALGPFGIRRRFGRARWLVAAAIVASFVAAPTSRADIYQWEYVNPADPSQGKQQSSTLAPGGAGVEAVAYADLSNRNLTRAYLNGVTLWSAKLNGANLTNAELEQANLSAASLTGTNFSGANVRQANFTELVVANPCTSGWAFCVPSFSFYGGIAAGQLISTGSYLEGDLSGINLSNDNLPSINLAGKNLTSAVFYGTTLTGANLTGANIRGANFGRYTRTVGCSSVYQGCPLEFTATFGSGLTPSQLSSTASYSARDLSGVNFTMNDLAHGNLFEQNLANAIFTNANLTNSDLSRAYITNAVFNSANLTTAILYGADARGSAFTDAVLTGAVLTNFIPSDGHISGLDLYAGQLLVVRDYDGNNAGPITITVDQHLAMGAGGKLRMTFEADAWDSTISFAPGIPVSLGGTLELLFADGTDASDQIGRTLKLFDWTGVAPTGTFNVVSPYTWNLSNLYTTGEVMLATVPEPSMTLLLSCGAVTGILTRRRSRLRAE